MTLISDPVPGCVKSTKFVEDLKTFLPRAENQSCSVEIWYCIELETQMNNPCSDAINPSKKGRNSSGEMTLPPCLQIAFHHLLHLHQEDTDIKVAGDIKAPNAYYRLNHEAVTWKT